MAHHDLHQLVKKVSRKLSVKIPAIVSALILIVSVITSLVLYTQVYNILLDTQREELIQEIALESRSLEYILEQADSTAKSMAKQPEVIDYLLLDQDEQTSEASQELLKHLNHFNMRGNLDSLYILDPSGVAVVSTNLSFTGNDYSFRNYYKAAVQGKTIVESAVGSTSDVVGFYFSAPIYSEDGDFLGVSAVKLSGNAINPLFDSKMRTDAEYLVDENGVITFSSQPELILSSLAALNITDENQAQFEKKYSGHEIKDLDQLKLWSEIVTTEGTGVYQTTDFLTKQPVYVAVTRVKNTPFYLLSSVKTSRLTTYAMRYSRSMAGLIIFSASLCMVLIIILLYRVIRPISQIKEIANMISQGKLNNSLPIHTGDDWEDLAESILKMQEKIRNNYRNLNQTVEDKTKELEKKIKELEKLNSVMIDRELRISELKEKLKTKKSSQHE